MTPRPLQHFPSWRRRWCWTSCVGPCERSDCATGASSPKLPASAPPQTDSQSPLTSPPPVSFHSHIEVCDFLRELLSNRSSLDLAGARVQGFLQALNLFQEFHLFRNNICAL